MNQSSYNRMRSVKDWYDKSLPVFFKKLEIVANTLIFKIYFG